jgi:hypothetical protein
MHVHATHNHKRIHAPANHRGQSMCRFRAGTSASLAALLGSEDEPPPFLYQVDTSLHTPQRGVRLADRSVHQDTCPVEDRPTLSITSPGPAFRRFIMAPMPNASVPGKLVSSRTHPGLRLPWPPNSLISLPPARSSRSSAACASALASSLRLHKHGTACPWRVWWETKVSKELNHHRNNPRSECCIGPPDPPRAHPTSTDPGPPFPAGSRAVCSSRLMGGVRRSKVVLLVSESVSRSVLLFGQ